MEMKSTTTKFHCTIILINIEPNILPEFALSDIQPFMIRDEFFNAVSNYDSTEDSTSKLWKEIEEHYSDASRHYHNLLHLENLTSELLPFRTTFTNWNVVIFAVVYHDIVYHASKNSNEEKSAAVAVKRLNGILAPKETVLRCGEFILATKRHEQVDDEVDLFTDADLSILGSSPDNYQAYTRQIRKEYSIYPDFLYNPGRKKVLSHFLGMETIYKTSFFRERYETLARQNLQMELSLL
jgi:predicted metal-dependent HD superfamily phosphohydrolase